MIYTSFNKTLKRRKDLTTALNHEGDIEYNPTKYLDSNLLTSKPKLALVPIFSSDESENLIDTALKALIDNGEEVDIGIQNPFIEGRLDKMPLVQKMHNYLSEFVKPLTTDEYLDHTSIGTGCGAGSAPHQDEGGFFASGILVVKGDGTTTSTPETSEKIIFDYKKQGLSVSQMNQQIRKELVENNKFKATFESSLSKAPKGSLLLITAGEWEGRGIIHFASICEQFPDRKFILITKVNKKLLNE